MKKKLENNDNTKNNKVNENNIFLTLPTGKSISDYFYIDHYMLRLDLIAKKGV